MTAPALERLFSPVRIGPVEVPNRIAMAPMSTDFAGEGGRVSRKLVDYLAARAAGGVGLVIAEATGVDPRHPYTPRSLGLWSDDLVPGYRELADAVHAGGAKVFPQVVHPGPDSLGPLLTGHEPLGPSAGIVGDITRVPCREASQAELAEIIGLFAETARRAREAGCDGIELHAAHAYLLLGSFLSPARNRRTDAYGGSPEGRLRLLREVIGAIRERVGRDFPVTVRISAEELVPGGRELAETLEMARALEAAGIDAFHLSSGAYPESSWRVIPPTGTPPGFNAPYGAALKQAVRVPVMVVGRIRDPAEAAGLLASASADLAVMGRALLADPELPRKAEAGRLEEIAPCVGCGLGCVVARERGGDMTCLVNPALGREGEVGPGSATPKRVMVAGGGPAGMMAAWTAARRGHRVTLYERERRLGGLYNLASVAPTKGELARVTEFLAGRLASAGVRVLPGTEVSEALLAAERPEALVVATGSEPAVPDIPGATGANVLEARAVLAGSSPPPTGGVLIVGGGMVGCELADWLVSRADGTAGVRPAVTIVEMAEEIGAGMFSEARQLLQERLELAGVRVLTATRVVAITPDGAVIERGSRELLTGCRWVILAVGSKPCRSLEATARALGIDARVVGDAAEPRQAVEAIAEGFEAGRRLG